MCDHLYCWHRFASFKRIQRDVKTTKLAVVLQTLDETPCVNDMLEHSLVATLHLHLDHAALLVYLLERLCAHREAALAELVHGAVTLPPLALGVHEDRHEAR